MSEPSSDSNPAATRRGRWREYRNILIATVGVGLFLKLFVVEAYRIPSPSMEETLFAGDFLLVNKLAYGPRSPRYFPLTMTPIPSFATSLFGSPQRGDVVVFESPVWREREPEGPVMYVKRCIAVPGDTVAIENSTVIVNRHRLRLPETGKVVKLIPFPPDYVDPRIYPAGAPFNADNYGPLHVPGAGEEVRVDTSNLWVWRELIRREGHTVSTKDGEVLIDDRPAEVYRVREDYYFMMGDNRRNSLDSRFWGFVPSSLLIGKAMLVYWSWEEPGGGLSAIRWGRIGTIVH